MPDQNDGYKIVENAVASDDVAALLKALSDSTVTRTKAGARHVLSNPAVSALASGERLLSIARQFIGPNPYPFRATLLDKSQEANWLVVWHQDTALPLQRRFDSPGWGPWSVKAGIVYAHAPATALEKVIALRVHLDDSTEMNGPLRVLPGSHTSGVLSDEAVERLAAKIPAVTCLAHAGGVIAMRPLLVHASSKSHGSNPRRVLHIEYAENKTLGADIDLAVA